MSPKTLQLDSQLRNYLLSVSLRDTATKRALREATARLSESSMQTSAEQGQLMELLVGLVGARRAIEVGTFTGYSALCVASALPEDGQLIACDVSQKWVDIGRDYWQEAGVAHKIETRIQPAVDTLDGLIADGQAGSFDFAYIDADKQNYVRYYEACLELVDAGGLIAVDNTLWSGRVADLEDTDPSTVAIRQFNDHVGSDERVDVSLVPIGDGLTLVRKR